MNYIAIQDFTASQFFFDRPSPNPQTKSFKKGDSIEATVTSNFSKQNVLVSSDGFNIPKNVVIVKKDVVGGLANLGIDVGSITSVAPSKYVFTQDASLKTVSMPMVGKTSKVVNFKKGDVVEGKLVPNKRYSEPPNYFIVEHTLGVITIPYGSKGGSVVAPYSEPIKENVVTDATQAEKIVNTETNDKILGMPKMVFFIGLGLVALVGGFIVYKKFIVKK